MASFLGKNLPDSIWKPDVLYLPEPLLEAHKSFLEEQGWWAEYDPNVHGNIGGATADEAKEHIINRFLNSAARMGFVCADPMDTQPEVREMVLDQLGEGQIFLLDLAAGNGAGTLSMLSLICELRAKKCVPKLPVNVHITGVDYSSAALKYYSEIMGKLDPWLKSNGLHVNLSLCPCDLAVVGDFGEVFESFLDESKRASVNRFLCVISAISGINSEGMGAISDSLKHAATGLSSKKRNSSWLWVEPHIGKKKAWVPKVFVTVNLTLKKIAHRFIQKGDTFDIKADDEVPTLEDAQPRSFQWLDPYKNKAINSNVIVVAFKNE